MKVEDGRPRLGPDPEAELDRLGEDDFLLGREERNPRDLAEVQPGRVLDIERVRRHLDGGISAVIVVGGHGHTGGRQVFGLGDDADIEIRVVDRDDRGHVRSRFRGFIQGAIGNRVNELDQDHSMKRQAAGASHLPAQRLRVFGRVDPPP